MRIAGPAAALGLVFAALFLSTSGTLFNWDAFRQVNCALESGPS